MRDASVETTATATTLGVIDIGSNSGRVLVARLTGPAHLQVVADARSPLRLVRDVARDGRLSHETIERTLRILRGFRAVSGCAGAVQTRAVATAAVREARNGQEFIDRVRTDLALPVEIADGDQEARFGFLGAVHGLPIEHGIVLDVGGGSLQLTHFRHRRLVRAWSLPLGALRLSDRLLRSDPPTRGEMRSLKQHVYERLQKAGVESLQPDERMIGTGGTVRNLAKLDRKAASEYPISRLHAYVLERRAVDDVVSMLSTTVAQARARLPGLNADRSDSIVGGGLVVQAVMDRLLARDLTVAGYGLREGLLLASFGEEPASIDAVREAALDALGSNFASWSADDARRRAQLVVRLLHGLDPRVSPEMRQVAACAAQLLDIGRSVDFYRREVHSARIVADANLDGYSHRTQALVAAVLLAAGEREATVKGFAPLVGPADQTAIEQVAATLVLTEAVARYAAAGLDDVWPERRDGTLHIDTDFVDAWPLDAPAKRAERAFGVTIRVRGGGTS
jgi:exopolyphosphatase / guanosine-5'-triphosphate,3'-diphosphate pyrophosphatase